MGNQPTCSCPSEYQGDQCQYSEFTCFHMSCCFVFSPVSSGDFTLPVRLPVLSYVRRILPQQRNVLTNLQRHQTLPVLQSVHRKPVRAGQMSVLWNGQVFYIPFERSHLQVHTLNANSVTAGGILCSLLTPTFCGCSCPNGQIQPSCYTCLNYCSRGQCSVDSRTLLPQCK